MSKKKQKLTLEKLKTPTVILVWCEVYYTYISYMQGSDQKKLGAIFPFFVGIVVAPFYLYMLARRWALINDKTWYIYLAPFWLLPLIPIIAGIARSK